MQKILIIDDNHSFIDSVKVILKDLNLNLNISSCDRYSTARQLMDEHDFDVIILDNETETSQKGVDFVEGVLRVNESLQKENFIIFSSRLEAQAAQFKAAGIKAFGKPFRIADFRHYIARLLEAPAG